VAIISVKGFFDTHVHTGPAPFHRIGDTIDIARWCTEAGMAGLVVKSHFESTISKVHHARREVTNLHIFSAIALNRGVGGINPAAVGHALHQGAKVVWMPTIDAQNHARHYGGTGTFGFKSMTLRYQKSGRSQEYLTCLENGRLTDETKEVIDAIAAHDAVLATGHLSKEEIFQAVDYALSKKVQRIVITHPEFVVPKLDIKTQVELAQQGCFMEYCAASIFPMIACATAEQVKEMIEAVTPERAILATDSGQPFSARTPEQMRVFAQVLHEKGVSEAAIAQMAIKNPAYLLGVTESAA